MRKVLLPLLMLGTGTAAGGLAACHSEAATGTAAAATGPAGTTATPTAAATLPPAPAPRYDIRGIFDPGFGGIVAFALKIPHGWTLQQSFTRRWIDNYPVEEIYTSVAAPDGKTVFENLPQLSYSYMDDPQMQQVMRYGEQQTGQKARDFLAPMLPVPYLKTVLLPLLARQAHLQARVTAEHQDPVQTTQQAGMQLQTATGYVDAVLPNGRKLRLQTQLGVVTMPALNNHRNYTWTADNLVIQSADDLATAVAQQAEVQKSVTINPAWAQKNAELKQRGSAANIQLRQRQTQQLLQRSQQQLAAQRQQFDQHNAAWAAQQRANTQASEAFRDYLGGQTLYQNAETGERTRVDNSYSHVYQNGSTVLGTSAPLDGNHVNWQELQQVELKNY